MDQRIIWNSHIIKEIEQAKKIIMRYKRKGYKILKSDGTIMKRFNPAFEKVIVKAQKLDKNIIKILTEKKD